MRKIVIYCLLSFFFLLLNACSWEDFKYHNTNQAFHTLFDLYDSTANYADLSNLKFKGKYVSKQKITVIEDIKGKGSIIQTKESRLDTYIISEYYENGKMLQFYKKIGMYFETYPSNEDLKNLNYSTYYYKVVGDSIVKETIYQKPGQMYHHKDYGIIKQDSIIFFTEPTLITIR